MKTRVRIQKKAPSQSTSTPVTNPLQRRSFGLETESQQQETSGFNISYEQAKHLSFNTANMSISAPGKATPSPIQTKLTIGKPGDKYEQEADRVASEVVNRINTPTPQQSAQSASIQRQEEPEKKEEVMAKPLAESIQRQEEPEKKEEVMAKPLAESIQRQEEPEKKEEVMAKPLA
ncbi:MAG: hypothetical protein F6K10_35480, partial [Moorea sp. SIO2B7]|nr:hypothetical protein [Moorena sp. SIO2B7]